MTNNQHRVAFLSLDSMLRVVALVLAVVATTASAQVSNRTDKQINEPGIPPARTPETKPPQLSEVRIWNVSNRPFKYRLARATGLRWTDEITLAPGKYQSIPVPKPGQPSELEGIADSKEGSVYESRFIGIRYPKYGGFMESNLPIEQGETPIPYWFHILDPNGYSQVVSAANVEEARERQTELQRQKPLTPQQIERLKFTLRSNWEFYDR
jgi:hypothetical protein